MELHQIFILRGAAVHAQFSQAHPCILAHGFYDIRDLVGDALHACPDHLRLPRSSGHPHDGRRCPAVPVGGAKARECRYQIQFVILDCFSCQSFRLSRRLDQLQVILKPGDDRARIVQVAFQHIVHFSAHAPRQGSYHSVGAEHRLLSDIHHNGRARPVGGLRHARLKASLSEQRTMRIPQHAVDWNFLWKHAFKVRLSKLGI